VAALTARLSDFRDSVGRIHNRAIFEIPQILQRILRDHERPIWAPAAPQMAAANS